MVKVTIEHNGERICSRRGELFLGQISSFEGCEATSSVMLVGSGEPQRVTESLEHMTVKTIKGLSKDPIVVCGCLIELQNGLDRAIREYMQENVDGLTNSIYECLTGKERQE